MKIVAARQGVPLLLRREERRGCSVADFLSRPGPRLAPRKLRVFGQNRLFLLLSGSNLC